MKNYISFQFIFCFIVSVCCYTNIQSVETQNLPYPYCDVQTVLPFNGHGWYMNAQWLEMLLQNNNIQTVVEVGSWLGTSTRHIASKLPKGGKVYAVDTWQGSVEHHQKPEWSAMLPTLYEQFLSNVIHSKLTDKIIPWRMHSLQAAQKIKEEKVPVDLMYIDASHDYASVMLDLQAYFSFAQGNKAILCGDDWSWQSVRSAVIDFAKANNLTVYGAYNFWFVKEEGSYQQYGFDQNPDHPRWKFS